MGVRERSPREAESFLSIFYTKTWPKIKDLNENLPRGLRRLLRAAMTDQPHWSMGGGDGRPVRPLLDPTLLRNKTFRLTCLQPIQTERTLGLVQSDS